MSPAPPPLGRRRRHEAPRGQLGAAVAATHERQVAEHEEGHAEEQHQHAGPEERHQRIRLRRGLDDAHEGRRQVVLGRHLVQVDAGPLDGVLQLALAPPGRSLEAQAELGIARVDRQELARLGVLHDDQPGIGQLELAGIRQADGHQLVALAEQRQGAPSPARR